MYSHFSTLHVPSFFNDSSCFLNIFLPFSSSLFVYLLCPSLSYIIYRSLPVILSYMGFARCPCLFPCLFGSAGFFCLPGFLIPACRFDSVQTLLSLSTRFSSHASGSESFDLRDYYLFMVILTCVVYRQCSQTQPCDH